MIKRSIPFLSRFQKMKTIRIFSDSLTYEHTSKINMRLQGRKNGKMKQQLLRKRNSICNSNMHTMIPIKSSHGRTMTPMIHLVNLTVNFCEMKRKEKHGKMSQKTTITLFILHYII